MIVLLTDFGFSEYAGVMKGVIYHLHKGARIVEMRVIPVPEDASHTFHGRDVFAKAAATIDQGHFDILGPMTRELKQLELYLNERIGMVVRIDRFGNIITNLPSEGKTEQRIEIA